MEVPAVLSPLIISPWTTVGCVSMGLTAVYCCLYLRTVRALRACQQRYRDTVENAVEGILQTSRDGKFVYVNPAFAHMLAYGSAEELLHTVTDIDHQIYVSPQVRRDFLHRLERDGVARCEYEARKKDGTTTWLFVSSRVVQDENGRFLYYESIAEDISDRRRREAELQRVAESLARSNDELRRFAHTVAHDLTEPLRTIHVYTELLVVRQGGNLAPGVDQYVQYITGAAKRMKLFVDDILNYSRSDWECLKAEVVDSGELVKQVMENLKIVILEARAQINVGTLANVYGDRAKLLRLFQNLISNALKFRSSEPLIISISSRSEAGREVFTVHDNGIGFEGKDAEKAFDLFVRLVDPRKYQGSGMGLAMCKRIVELHGGRIWVDSQPGAGAQFHFTLPQVVAVAASLDAPFSDPVRRPAPRDRG